MTVPDRGTGLGLPEQGPGSPGGFPRRLAAYLVDSVVAALIGGLFVRDLQDGRRGLVTLAAFAALYLLLGSTTGQTMGMRLLRLRMLTPSAPDQPPGLRAMLIRTALLLLLVPVLVFDRDGRGLHDRAAGTVVVRT